MSKNTVTIAALETKSLPFEIKEFDDEKGIVRGYLSTFNNIDDGNDRVLPGSFKRTIANKYEYKKKHGMRYIMPLLWQHDANNPIGGYLDAKEDNIGLFVELELDLDVQKGKEAYSALKKGYVFQQSIGYDVLQSEYVKVENKTVRDLIEIRLYEGSLVTFPMNSEAVVTDVKSNINITETKGACGNTSGPIGPRDESWDGSKAEKQIWSVAEKEDGTISASIAKKYFMNCDGDGSKKGDYSYPFWFVGSDPHICVGAVKAIASAIGGARNASPPDGLKSKVEKLYRRISSKYPDSPALVPPWKDEGKGKSKHMQKKTVQEHYADEMCDDLLEDWQDVFVCALTCAILDAFKIGDQPEADVSAALDDFKSLVLTKFVPEAIDCDLSGYLTDNSYSSADYTMQYGSDSKPNYGYMSNSAKRDQKAGKPISATNQQKIDDHVKNIKALARSAKSAMREHVNDMHDAADSVAGLAEIDTTKSGRAISAATAQSIKSAADTMHDHADKAMSIMQEHTKAVRTAADDFANTMQGAETPYAGDDPGKPEPGQQEGKSNTTNPPQQARGTQTRPSQDTVDEEKELELALQDLKNWKAKLTV